MARQGSFSCASAGAINKTVEVCRLLSQATVSRCISEEVCVCKRLCVCVPMCHSSEDKDRCDSIPTDSSCPTSMEKS